MKFLRRLFDTSKEAGVSLKKGDTTEPKGTMYTLERGLVVEPFSKINYWELPQGGRRVRAYVLTENPIEGAQTGVAIDGSGSMQSNFGLPSIRQMRAMTRDEQTKFAKMGLLNHQGNFNMQDARTLPTLVAQGVLREFPGVANVVEQQARDMTAYLSKFDADGGTTVIYWATGDGYQLEEVGDLTGAECATARFAGPQRFGTGTHLLPAIKYFVERFVAARWGIYTFITDGALNDLEAVKRYCIELAGQIARGQRNPVKFVLIGVGDDIDEAQMQALDDLDTGTDIDLWDHKIAREMQQLAEIFTEVVSESMIIAPGMGVVRDATGRVIKDYRDSGLPALLWFDLPPGTTSFSLDIAGQVIDQPLTRA